MKTRLLVFVFLLGLLPASAIEPDFNHIFRKYSGVEGVTSIRLPRVVFRLALLIKDIEEPEREFIRNIDRLWILQADNPSQKQWVNFSDDCKRVVDSGRYEELMRVNDKGERVHILIREKKGYISDVVILVAGRENVLVRMQGRFSMEDIGRLSEETNLKI